MRRGGGSRGGSIGGRSFGGGSRSSRIARSSRRHYRHRPYHRHRPYYGHRYYGRRYYGGGPGIFGIVFFLFFILMFVGILVSAGLSSSSTHVITLSSETTYAVEYNSFSDGTVDIDLTNGQLETYIFDGLPPIDHTNEFHQNYTSQLNPAGTSYEYYALSLSKGTTIEVDWTADHPLTYYAIRGESNLDEWEDGDDAQFYDQYGAEGTHTYTVSESDTYFFAVEDTGSTNNYQIFFDMNIPVYDLSNALDQSTGSQVLQPQDISGNVLIFYNPSTTDDARMTVVVNSAFSFFQVFLVFMGGVLILLTIVYKKGKGRGQQSRSNPPPRTSDQGAQSTGYMTRPSPKYCNSCGSGVLPNSKFCIECGTSLS